jgi:F-type H+-transporting ATPase subunit delta
MAGDFRAARRYSKALFNTALGMNAVDEVASSLATVTAASKTTPDLMTVLHHPLVSQTRKKELLHAVFGESLMPIVESFLFLLVEKDRAIIIDTVAAEFARLVDAHRGIADAEAVSAVEITEAQRVALQRQLETSTGKQIRLQTRVDESLLGGLVVRVGDQLIDGSVATQLQRMREGLKQVKVS